MADHFDSKTGADQNTPNTPARHRRGDRHKQRYQGIQRGSAHPPAARATAGIPAPISLGRSRFSTARRSMPSRSPARAYMARRARARPIIAAAGSISPAMRSWIRGSIPKATIIMRMRTRLPVAAAGWR